MTQISSSAPLPPTPSLIMWRGHGAKTQCTGNSYCTCQIVAFALGCGCGVPGLLTRRWRDVSPGHLRVCVAGRWVRLFSGAPSCLCSFLLSPLMFPFSLLVLFFSCASFFLPLAATCSLTRSGGAPPPRRHRIKWEAAHPMNGLGRCGQGRSPPAAAFFSFFREGALLRRPSQTQSRRA